ncbi:MAG: M23 family metallopeptidase [Pseudomonadota bacterium]
MATRTKDQKPTDGVSVYALGTAFNAGNPVQSAPLDADAAPLFDLLTRNNAPAIQMDDKVAFGITDALSAAAASFSRGKPGYDRPGSIFDRVNGPTGQDFSDSANQQTIGSVLAAGKFTVPTVSNLRFGDPVEGAERISSTIQAGRKHPTLGVVRNHHGVDLAAPAGRDVLAAAPGVVVFSGIAGKNINSGYGNTVVVLHNDAEHGYFYTLYGHNSKNIARVGQRVEAGQHIAEVGSTGDSSGNHLHFEIGRLSQNGSIRVVDASNVVKGGLTADAASNMSGMNAGGFVSNLLNKMNIQVAQAEGPKMPAPSFDLN